MRIERTQTFLEDFRSIRDRRAQAAITIRIERQSACNPGDVRPVGEGVSELRIHVGAGWRVYFTRRGEALVILLCLGDKSDQAADVIRAKRLAATSKEIR